MATRASLVRTHYIAYAGMSAPFPPAPVMADDEPGDDDPDPVPPDPILGGPGDDILQSGEASDTLDGGDGFDYASYSDAPASVFVDLSNPALNNGYAFGDIFISIEGLIGSAFNDTLRGDAGNNILEGGGGADTLIGNGGSDDASYAHAAAGVSASLRNNAAATGDAAGDIFIGISGLVGSAFGDALEGSAFADRLAGGGGADLLDGNGGNDLLLGQDGDDLVFGRAGNDWMEGGDGSDRLYAGDDNDRLDGGAGNDILDGEGGADTLIGGLGDDWFVVDNALDGIFENDGEGSDVVFSTISWAINANVEVLSLQGNAAIDAFGNDAANTLVGNHAANALYGYGGDDWMEAHGGNDFIAGGDGIDRLDGGDGNDVLVGEAGTDILIGGAGADTFRWNSAAESNTTTGFDYIYGFEQGIDKMVAPRQSAADTIALEIVGADTVLWIDYGGDGSRDLAAVLIGVTNITTADVILG